MSLNQNEERIWARMVTSLAKDGQTILDEMSAEQAHAWHMATGIAGEAGEVIDAVKKYVIYQKPIDLLNIQEELGDLEFYMEGLRQAFDLDRGTILEMNHNKLAVLRYPDGYTNEAAIERADKQDDEPKPSPFQESS